MTERFARESGFTLASFKARGDDKGEFSAIVSVFGNVDLGGDRVMPGAFDKSLAKWQESGDPIPVIWNHQWDNPLAHIGAIDPADAVETDEGLMVKGTLDLDNAFAAQVHRLLMERRVKELSFGYNVVDAKRAKDGALDLLELDLIEVGPTLKGMNPDTSLLAVKAWDALAADVAAVIDSIDTGWTTKAGARHSKETLAEIDAITEQVDAIKARLSALRSAGSDKAAPVEETGTPDEAEAIGKASDVDADLITQIKLLKEGNHK